MNQAIAVIRSRRIANHEIVRVQPSIGTVLHLHVFQEACHIGQKPVSRLLPEKIVDDLEASDIHAHDLEPCVRIPCEDFLCFRKKSVFVENSRQCVMAERKQVSIMGLLERRDIRDNAVERPDAGLLVQHIAPAFHDAEQFSRLLDQMILDLIVLFFQQLLPERFPYVLALALQDGIHVPVRTGRLEFLRIGIAHHAPQLVAVIAHAVHLVRAIDHIGAVHIGGHHVHDILRRVLGALVHDAGADEPIGGLVPHITHEMQTANGIRTLTALAVHHAHAVHVRQTVLPAENQVHINRTAAVFRHFLGASHLRDRARRYQKMLFLQQFANRLRPYMVVIRTDSKGNGIFIQDIHDISDAAVLIVFPQQ